MITSQADTLNTTRILNELIKIQEQNSSCSLWQFRSLISANQYYRLYQYFLNYVSQGSEVLDWGCGNGHFSYFLVSSGYKTSGFSFDDFCLRSTLNNLTYQFKQGSLDEPSLIPFSDNQFNAIVSVGVLEHVRETGGTEISSLKEIFRILKPGGIFICYHFPNQFSLIEAIASRLPNKYHHQYRYTRASIEALCQVTGFEVLEIKRYGFLPRNLWGVFPKPIRNSQWLAYSWDLLDHLLSYPFSVVCQNYLFVARKPFVDSASTEQHTNLSF